MQKSFLKVIIIGDSGVGKTSLLEAFNYQKIQKNSKPTIGAEFTKKKITLGDYPDSKYKGKEVNLQLWDTAGQERFQSLCTSFYRGSDCCMLVFDVSQIETYESLDNWREVFQQTTGDQTQEIPIILIGNKSDKPKAINTDVVQSDWVQTGKAKAYIETSALKVLGVDNIFNSVAYHALEYLEQQRVSNQQMINVKNMRQSFSENSGSTKSTNNRIKMTRSKERQIINKKQQCGC
eukprot:403347422